MEKSDLMRALIKNALDKKLEDKKLSSNKKQEDFESKDHIFESNQVFQVVKKRIVKKRD